jgi:predicted dehydrogenase
MKIINIIGAGLIGQERMKAVAKLQARGHLVKIGYVYDPFQTELGKFAAKYDFKIAQNEKDFFNHPADLVVIACPHDGATGYACHALQSGHHILLEKPLGRNDEEAKQIADAAEQAKRQVFVGLNYRFMPGVKSLVEDWRSGHFGKPIALRMQLGHGGKPGDEKTWKLDPIRCGGGALLDPGIHLLDLAILITGSPLTIKSVTSWSGFWNTGIEEEVHLMLTKDNVLLSIEVSIVRWKSSFEIVAKGTDGYGIVTGRGRSYGLQRYVRGERWGWQQAKDQASSEKLILEDACEDSFADELATCLQLEKSVMTPANLQEGLVLMKLYQDAKTSLS